MEYRYLNVDERYKLKDIYMDIFEDPEIFVDYYLDEYSKDTDSYVCEDNGIIIAMANVHYKVITYCKREYNAAYIYGVATKEQYRHRGIMTSLLTRLIENILDKDIELIYLVPAVSEKVYEKLGFNLIREEKKYIIYKNDTSDLKRVFTEETNRNDIFLNEKEVFVLDETYDNIYQMEKDIKGIFEAFPCEAVEYKVRPIMIYTNRIQIQWHEYEEDDMTLIEQIYRGFMFNDEV